MDTAGRYRRFAEREARGRSATYESWALAAAGDEEMLALLERIPETHRQPYLVFAVSRYLGAPVAGYGPWRTWALDNQDQLVGEAAARTTQTNEPRRCASLLPALAAFPQPIALIEVGAAAGLCLYPDRYSYRYGETARIDPAAGASDVVLECATSGGVPVPAQLPRIAERVAIDLHPLDVSNPDDVAWLESLVWPEETERLDRIRAACNIARADPPRLLRADVSTVEGLEVLVDAVAGIPAGVTPVVVTPGVLVYIPFRARERLVAQLLELDAGWVALEGVDVIPGVREALGERARPGAFVLSVDGSPVAWSSPLGHDLEWIPDAARG